MCKMTSLVRVALVLGCVCVVAIWASSSAEPVCTKERMYQAKQACRALRDRRREFGSCANQAAYRSCVFDYCMTRGESVQESLCNNIEEFVSQCEADKGIPIEFEWRAHFGCST